MKTDMIKKALILTGAVMLLAAAALPIHIYWVSRPHADEHTIAMARIDFKQDITTQDAGKITAWLSQQPGVEHVVCNPACETAVFTFYPVRVSATKLVADLSTDLHYKAQRFVPSAEDMKRGCPVNAGSLSHQVVTYIKNKL